MNVVRMTRKSKRLSGSANGQGTLANQDSDTSGGKGDIASGHEDEMQKMSLSDNKQGDLNFIIDTKPSTEKDDDVIFVIDSKPSSTVKPSRTSLSALDVESDASDNDIFIIDNKPSSEKDGDMLWKSKSRKNERTCHFEIDNNPGAVEGQGQRSHTEGDSSEDSCWSDSDEDEDKPSTSRSKNQDSHNKEFQLSSSLQPDIDVSKHVYLNIDPFKEPQLKNKKLEGMKLSSGNGKDLLKKSVLQPGYEKQSQVVPYEQSLHQQKKNKKLEKDKTKGKGWFDMRAPEMTEERRNDLMVLQMRRSLDPKRFYKGPDIRGLPKFFQTGTIVADPIDFYSARIPKKQRKKTLVDELLADAEFRQFNKRKYAEIQESKVKAKGPYRHMKRLKKKK